MLETFEKRPEDFDGRLDVAGAYIEINGKLLFLQLSKNKEQCGCWSVPAGKFEPGEKPKKALRRELFEETGIFLKDNHLIHSLGELYIRKPGIDYVYHLFKIDFSERPEVILSEEHCAFCWVSMDEVKQLDLLEGAEEALNFYIGKIR